MEAIGQLTGGLAHDFNNLLTVILGNAEALAEQVDDPRLRGLAEITQTAAERGAELTSQLLAFSRRQALEPKVIDVNKLISGMDKMMRRMIGAHIEIELIRGAGLWNATADPAQLESALLNLAINARDAMGSGGKLTIETCNSHIDETYAATHDEVAPGRYVLISVTDTGTGMSPETMAKAFDPFFSTKEVGKGTGLGLSMVFGFVKQSGGHIRIRSQVGVGTTVELYLPRHTPKGRETIAVAEAALDENRLRGQEAVLLVEDDPDIRDFVARTLTGFGYGVREAANGREALAVLAMDAPVDLLLSDMTMPGGIGGHDLVLEARRQRPALRVLLMSGFTDMAGQLPADCALLEKPFQKLDLARAVRLTLDRAASPSPADPEE